MTGDEGNGAGVVAVGQGNAGTSGHAESGCHSRHNFIGDAGLTESFSFLADPAKDAGIATLEAHDPKSLAGGIDHGLVDERAALDVAGGEFVNANSPGR